MAGTGDPEQGRRNNRRGQARQRETAQWLRHEGLYFEAEHVGQFPGDAWQSDLRNVGPRVIEVTVVPWDKITQKLRQAEQAATNGHTGEFYVWKHIGRGNNESGSVADSVMITRARVIWPLLRELDILRAFRAKHAAEWENWEWQRNNLTPDERAAFEVNGE